MPRPPRYPLIGVPQHVIQRRNNRQPTFFPADDFRYYLECLKAAATSLTLISLFRGQRSGCPLHLGGIRQCLTFVAQAAG